jgi:UDP-N-acetylmuramoyl-L-alanyl-D-glutamate--2,6-diaminopimelate ligase
VVTDSPEMFGELRARQPELALAMVEHGRRALAEVSSAVFDRPQGKLKLSAVTGTNGKTTTAFLLEQMLASVGRKNVLLGTIETRIGEVVRPSEHTTPESRDILALFAEGVRAGCTEAVMEMSSHALDQERVWGLPVDVAIFTNLTQDHLDYHGDMESYARAKAKLFRGGMGAPPPRVAVINDDAEYAGMMMDSYEGEEFVVRYGLGGSPGANHCAEDLKLSLGDTRFRFRTPGGSIAIRSPLSGRVNVENLLASMCAALARGVTLEQVAEAVETLKAAPGRFEVVPGSREAGFTVVVDYAHTPDALENLIRLARESVRERGGRVITLFGCGGDRDKTKRPRMGRVAAAESDFIVLTSDNPRSEEPMAIINDVLVGVREHLGMFAGTFVVEEDRRAAIEVAVRAAKPGDIVLLAGKGHEKTQTFADAVVPFDDVAEAERLLKVVGSD